MKIKHYINEVRPNIFAIVVKNKYDRAMLFCRAQEYYESPSSKFRGKAFSIWDYMKWYHNKYGKGFSYGDDWSGFNIPLNVINECYSKLTTLESPYDINMCEIIASLNHIYKAKDAYVIACGDTKGDTFKHEVCHGLYHTNPEYKKKMDALTKGLPKKYYNIFKKNLLEMGYASKVVNDEIQAYLQYGYGIDSFGKGVDIGVRMEYSNLYKNQTNL